MRSQASIVVRKLRLAALGTAAASLSISAAACGSSPPISAKPTGSNSAPTFGTSSRPAAITTTVGSDCSILPAKGLGSVSSMSTQDAIAAASTNPQLSVFIAAVRTAGLDKPMTSKQSYTLIIPANSAFASLSKNDVIRLKNSGELQKVIKYHAVGTTITPQQFASGATVTTLEGGKLTLAKSGTVYKVGPATVLCGNIRTANATIYIVSKVLLPPK